MAKVQNLVDLPDKKIRTGLNLLQKRSNVSPERWLAMLGADPTDPCFTHLRAAFPLSPTGIKGQISNQPPAAPKTSGKKISRGARIVYHAERISRILGLPIKGRPEVPKAHSGEILLYYDGWDLKTLRNSRAGQECMRQDQTWYEDFSWSQGPGYYRVILNLDGTDGRNWREQMKLVAHDEGWAPAPVYIATTALVAYRCVTGNDFLNGCICRCGETTREDVSVQLQVYQGTVFLDDYTNYGRMATCLAVCKKV